MPRIINPITFIVLIIATAAVNGQDVRAIGSGAWNDTNIWSTGQVPGSTNDVYIGTDKPGGLTAPVATVTLNGDTAVKNVFLGWGYGSGLNGTLDLAGHALTASNYISLGTTADSLASIIHNGGSIKSAYLLINSGNTFDFETGDTTKFLNLNTGSFSSTSSSQNIEVSATLYRQSVLDLGADLVLGAELDIRSGSTVNMNGHNVNAFIVRLGSEEYGTVQLNRGVTPGSIQASTVFVGPNMDFNVLADDAISQIIGKGAHVTIEADASVSSVDLNSADLITQSSGAVTNSISLLGEGTVHLGGDISLSDIMLLRGVGATLELNGHQLEAKRLTFGNSTGDVVVLDRGVTPGSIKLDELLIGYGNTLDILATDDIDKVFMFDTSITFQSGGSIAGLEMRGGSTVTTIGTESITRSLLVSSGSTLEMNADLNLSDYLQLQGMNSTIKLNGHDITATNLVDIESGITIDRGVTPGHFTTSLLRVHNISFDLLSGDNVTTFELQSSNTAFINDVSISNLILKQASTANTTHAGNITTGASLTGNSVLNLGADLQLNGLLEISKSVVNANGFDIHVGTISLLPSNGAERINRGSTPGSITADNLWVNSGTFQLLAQDSVKQLKFENGVSSTLVTTSNITESVILTNGSRLDLASDLILSGSISIDGPKVGGVPTGINAHGYDITADQLAMGFNSSNAASITNIGTLDVNELFLNRQSVVSTDHGVIHDIIFLLGGSIFNVGQHQGEGLTFEGGDSIFVSADSHIDLHLDESGWAFRWQNISPTTDWISTIEGMLTNGQFRVLSSPGIDYSVFSQDGYTYIGTAVPEVSSVVMASCGLLIVGLLIRNKTQQARISSSNVDATTDRGSL